MVNHLKYTLAGSRDPGAFDVLGDGTRRRLIALLAEKPRHPAEMAQALGVSRPAISRHIRLLRSRGLLKETLGRGDGRTRLCQLRTAPLNDASEWLQGIQQFWTTQLAAFTQYVTMQSGAPRRQIPRPCKRRRGR